MVTPVSSSHEHGPPMVHGHEGITKGSDHLTGLLTQLQDLSTVSNLPPAVQQLVDLGSQLQTLLGSKDLSQFHHIIPALHKTMGHLEPIVHQFEEEMQKTSSVDFTNGPFSTAWTNTLLEKANTEMTSLINLLQG